MSYRRLVSVTGFGFFPLGFLARLPYAMAPLAGLILIEDATGSFTLAGVAGAAQSMAMAASGPVIGVLADRFGQRAVGVATTLANIAALLGLLFLASGGRAGVMITATLAGLTQPQVGPLVRVYWSRLVGRTDLEATALAYEAAADETSFVVGPALVGLLTPMGHAAPLVAVIVLLSTATLPFAARYEGPPATRVRGRTGQLPVGRLAGLFVAMAAIGAIFGVVQTGVAAYSADGAGLIYAEFGVGSALAGVACASLPVRFGPWARYLVFAGALFAGMIALTVLPVPIGIAVASVTVAPYLICLYSLAQRLGPGARAATIMTILCAGGPLGTAVGRAVAGRLVDLHGAEGALAAAPIIAGGAACLAVVLVLAERLGELRRRGDGSAETYRVGR